MGFGVSSSQSLADVHIVFNLVLAVFSHSIIQLQFDMLTSYRNVTMNLRADAVAVIVFWQHFGG